MEEQKTAEAANVGPPNYGRPSPPDEDEAGDWTYRLTQNVKRHLVLTDRPLPLSSQGTTRHDLFSTSARMSVGVCRAVGKLELDSEFAVSRRLTCYSEREGDGGRQVYLQLADGRGWTVAFHVRTGVVLAHPTSGAHVSAGSPKAAAKVVSLPDPHAVLGTTIATAGEASVPAEAEHHSRGISGHETELMLLPLEKAVRDRLPSTLKAVHFDLADGSQLKLRKAVQFEGEGGALGVSVTGSTRPVVEEVSTVLHTMCEVLDEWRLEHPLIEVQCHAKLDYPNPALKSKQAKVAMTRERAFEVVNVLVSCGVPRTMLQPCGLGLSVPIRERDSPWNQRVEVHILAAKSWESALRYKLTADPQYKIQAVEIWREKYDSEEVTERIPEGAVLQDFGNNGPRYQATSALRKHILLRASPSNDARPTGHRVGLDTVFKVNKRCTIHKGLDNGGDQVWLKVEGDLGWCQQYHQRNGVLLVHAAMSTPGAPVDEAETVKERGAEVKQRLVKPQSFRSDEVRNCLYGSQDGEAAPNGTTARSPKEASTKTHSERHAERLAGLSQKELSHEEHKEKWAQKKQQTQDKLSTGLWTSSLALDKIISREEGEYFYRVHSTDEHSTNAASSWRKAPSALHAKLQHSVDAAPSGVQLYDNECVRAVKRMTLTTEREDGGIMVYVLVQPDLEGPAVEELLDACEAMFHGAYPEYLETIDHKSHWSELFVAELVGKLPATTAKELREVEESEATKPKAQDENDLINQLLPSFTNFVAPLVGDTDPSTPAALQVREAFRGLLGAGFNREHWLHVLSFENGAPCAEELPGRTETVFNG